MSQELLLTAFHCVVAAIVAPAGLAAARTIAEEQPVAALAVSFLAVVFPVLIATRVAWTSGYAAGLEEAEAPAQLASRRPALLWPRQSPIIVRAPIHEHLATLLPTTPEGILPPHRGARGRRRPGLRVGPPPPCSRSPRAAIARGLRHCRRSWFSAFSWLPSASPLHSGPSEPSSTTPTARPCRSWPPRNCSPTGRAASGNAPERDRLAEGLLSP